MQKYISITAVLLLLFIVPLGSWYYLKKGVDYRKGALSELLPKDSIVISQDTLHFLNDKTSILVLKKFEKLNEVVNTIDKQFENTPKFQLLMMDSFINTKHMVLPNGYFSSMISKFEDKSLILVDNKMKIRNAYGSDDQSIRKLIEHTAIILPRPKETDIEYKSK